MSNASDKEKDSLSLESLAAYLESYSSGADAALAKLRPIPGPASIEHQLKILLRENRTEEALALISNETPDLQWIALGIQTAATQGALEISKKLFDEVDRSADVTLRIRCAIGHAEGSLKAIFAAHGDPPFLIPGDISVQENSALLGAVAHFSPLLSQISARGVVDNELESQGLQLLLTIWLLIGDREKAGDVVAFLFKRTPIPLRAVEAVMQGLLTCDPSLPSKVRTDHPGSFKAGILACLLEGRILNQPKFAFHNAVKLKVLASNEEDKESLAEFLYEMAAKLNDNAFVEFAVQTARELLSEESNVTALIEIDTILRSGDAEAALQRLLAMDDQDNAIWLGLYGSVLLKLGKEEKALEAFLSLSKKSPEPSVFRQISALARKVGDENTRELALLTLLKIDPNDIWTRQELGKIYAESKRYTLAIEQFRWLSWNEPEEVGYSINLAVSLTFSGDLGSAATVLEEAVRRHPTELRVLVLLSEVYLSQGHSQRAFSCLDSFKNSYWESPEFLLPYMNAGYASGHENEASAAFVKLQELNDEGQVGPGLIRAVPLDEVVQLVKHDRQQNTEWLKGEVAGEMPWVLAASLRNEVPYSAWFHKTRPIRFSYEDASTWAAAHTYITNGFRIYEKDAGNLELSAFTAPNSQNEVVVDLSSLIILNELDLLDVVADFFSKLVIPADYISRIAHETKNLFPHQASQQEAAESISRSIERGQIRIVNIEQQAVLPVVDEYNHDALNKSENYSLDEIFEVMHRNGYLSDAMRERAKKLASPQGKQKENLSLFPRQSLVIALSSLRTVVMTGLLEPLIRCFVVCISNEDERDNADRVNFYSSLALIRRKHSSMWSKIRSNPKFEIRAGKNLEKEERQTDLDAALSAVSLATEVKLPLMADDRVCQSVVANERRDNDSATFGTVEVLTRLWEANLISDERAGSCFIQLIKWRCRFIVVPSGLLKIFAARYISHPPGEELRLVANYLHKCMCDPGLFSGPEVTNPPVPLAVRFYREWIQVITDFVMDIWMDARFSVDYAAQLTKWSMEVFLPSVPKNLSIEMQATLGELTSRMVMTTAFIRSSGSKAEDCLRTNSGLTTISRCLGLDDNYMKLLTEVVNARAI